MEDAQGKTIEPGDFVAYAIRFGNSSTMRFGIVQASMFDAIKIITATNKGRKGWEIGSVQTIGRKHAILAVEFAQLDLKLVTLLNNAYWA